MLNRVKNYGDALTHRREVCFFTPKNKRRKIVIQLTLDNKFIKEWPGLCLAAKELGILKGGISKACRKNKKYFGYKWIFK